MVLRRGIQGVEERRDIMRLCENQIKFCVCRMGFFMLAYSSISSELYKRFSPSASDWKHCDSFYSESLMKSE